MRAVLGDPEEAFHVFLFDLALEVSRGDNGLVLTRKPIRVDDTPLRIRGTVGRSLYRSLRAAGAPRVGVGRSVTRPSSGPETATDPPCIFST